MSSATLAQWLQHLETLHPSAMELGLERIGRVARALGLLPTSYPVITVAGTNGKGSTVAVIEAMLKACGERCGVYTSPHILRFNERIRIVGREVADDRLVDVFARIEAARGETSLTYFEFATLAALMLFRGEAVQVAVLEVGLGGRLDAANLVDASVAVITSIDLDHREWLGNSRGAIAREKAGILRPGAPAVIADPDPPEELLESVQAIGARGLYLGREFGWRPHAQGWRGWLFGEGGVRRELPALPAGPLLPENVCAGLQAMQLLGISFSDSQVLGVVPGVQPGARRQLRRHRGREYLLDVAHNPAAVRALREFIRENPCAGRSYALFSAMSDKDIRGMIRASADCFDAWFLADQPETPRAAAAADILLLLREAGCVVSSLEPTLAEAFARARSELREGDRLVVFGSFLTVAAVMQQLEEDRNGT